ncbi:hypothetical protein N656DRAFT_586550 [Canariomyces notabilis]|uniref:Uncharacterized protein n=1 Tax=Canariomyces notabilis TaxID=2074819 RepID=A0AAN6TH28_9PEZI|nr:hypothetical protein N656DRAFT_586550 [Canariomyces arenarius]
MLVRLISTESAQSPLQPTSRSRMAPAAPPHPLDLRGQIIDNCQFFSRPDAGISLVVAKEPLGTFKAFVLRAEDGIRDVLLSEAGQSVYEALQALHVKSAEAVQNYIANNGFALPQAVKKQRAKQAGNHGDGRDSDAASVSSTVTIEQSDTDCGSLSDNETVSVTSVGRAKRRNQHKAKRSTKHKSRRSRSRSRSPFSPQRSLSSSSESDDDFAFRGSTRLPPIPFRQAPGRFNPFPQPTARLGNNPGNEIPPHERWRPFLQDPSCITIEPAEKFERAANRPPGPPSTAAAAAAAMTSCGYTPIGVVTGAGMAMAKPPAGPAATGPNHVGMPTHSPSTAAASQPGPQPQPQLMDLVLVVRWRHHGPCHHNQPRATLQQLPYPLTVRQIQDAALTYVRRQPGAFASTSTTASGPTPPDMTGLLSHRLWQLRATVKTLIVGDGEEVDLGGYTGSADLTRLVVAGSGAGSSGIPRVEVDVFGEGPVRGGPGTGVGGGGTGLGGMMPPVGPAGPVPGTGAVGSAHGSSSGQAIGLPPPPPPPPPSRSPAGSMGLNDGVGAAGLSHLPPATGHGHQPRRQFANGHVHGQVQSPGLPE